MNNERDIFCHALGLESPTEREELLLSACGQDTAMAARIRQLLAAHARVGKFLAGEPDGNADLLLAVNPIILEAPGDRIGRYTLLEKIGEGGCGVVFMAEQEEPVRRKVALKIIKPGMDSRQVIARFEAERQALAMMDHPNIAKFLDAGVVAGVPPAVEPGVPPGGRNRGLAEAPASVYSERQSDAGPGGKMPPSTAGETPAATTASSPASNLAPRASRLYFVMELVRGIRITDYCEQHRLSTRERLDLFIAVCHAVQHAHQKGIIHRDLKPSNILVTENDGVAVPKVIDFGIAKATEQKLTDKTLFTQFTAFLGTPAYMSPEQAAMTSLDIDTRSDIYSLGVLLYELLTGTTPFDAQELLKAGFDEMRRIIRETEPERPSTRLTRVAAGVPPAVEGGILPPGLGPGTSSAHGAATPVPPGGTPGSTAGGTPAATSLAPRRAGRAKTLNSQLKPLSTDLDWIVMKCLEKDRARRYETANGLAADLQRHLNDEPVVARPPSAAYRFQKMVRRNKTAFAAAVALLLVAGLGVMGILVQLRRAERERARAELQSQRAEDQATRAEQNAANERRERYYASIAAADSHIRNGDIDVALSVLTNCPPEIRHWEWGRLLYLCHQSISTTKLPSGSAEVLNVNATATRAVAVKSLRTVQRAACWDLVGGQELFEVASEANLVVATAFSPDGERLAVALLNGVVTIWEAQSGRQLTQFLSTNEVQSLQFNADGTRLAVSCVSGSGLWMDAASGQVTSATPQIGARFRSAALDPSGRFWATMDDDALVTVRDARTGEARFQFQGFADVNIMAFRYQPLLAFSPDGSRLVAHASEKSARVWNTETGREILFIPSKVFGLAFDADAKQVAIFSGGKTAELWDLATGEKAQTVYAHRRRVTFVGFDGPGTLLRTGCEEGLLKAWPATTGREWITHPFRVDSVEFHPGGERFVTTQFDGLAKVWETDSARQRLTLRANWSWARTASYSPDGKRIVTGGADRFARVFDAESGRELVMMKGHTSAVRSAVFSPDGRTIATASWDKTVRLWDAATGKELFVLRGHSDSVRFAAFSPDGARLTSVAHDSKVHVWETATGRHLTTLAGGNSALAISRDGRRVATGNFSGSIRLWDGDMGQLLARWSARAGIQALDFSPDGKRLLVVASDSTGEFIQPSLEIWDVEAGRQVLVLSGHPAMVLGAKFSPDGRRIVSGSWAYGARLWETFPWEERLYPDAQASPLQGGTGDSPVPRGDPPRGSDDRTTPFFISGWDSARTAIPSGQWPDGTGRLPVPPGPGTSATPLLARIQAHAESYWSARLNAEAFGRASNSNLPPVEPLRFPQSVWPMRDPAAGRNQIDLSAHYNTPLNLPDGIVTHESLYDDDLSDLPTGLVTFNGVSFDVRGMVCLQSATNAYLRGAAGAQRHSSIQGIPVGYSARQIHLLHSMARESGAGIPSDGTLLCRYILHFADGTRHELPILYGRDVRECWERDNDIKPESDRGVVVWRGTNPAVARRGGRLRLYLRTLDNPRPEVEIKSIDLISAHPPCVPILIALTLEP